MRGSKSGVETKQWRFAAFAPGLLSTRIEADLTDTILIRPVVFSNDNSSSRREKSGGVRQAHPVVCTMDGPCAFQALRTCPTERHVATLPDLQTEDRDEKAAYCAGDCEPVDQRQKKSIRLAGSDSDQPRCFAADAQRHRQEPTDQHTPSCPLDQQRAFGGEQKDETNECSR